MLLPVGVLSRVVSAILVVPKGRFKVRTKIHLVTLRIRENVVHGNDLLMNFSNCRWSGSVYMELLKNPRNLELFLNFAANHFLFEK